MAAPEAQSNPLNGHAYGLVVVNPHAAGWRSATGSDLLTQTYNGIIDTFGIRNEHILETTGDDKRDADNLQASLGPGVLVFSVSGDGHTSKVAQEIAVAEARDQITMASVPAGNKNNLAVSLNGRLGKTWLAKVVQEGERVPVHLINTLIDAPGQSPEVQSSIAYRAWGPLSSTIAHTVTQPDFRNRPHYNNRWMRRVYEMQCGLSSLRALRPFVILREGASEPEALDELNFMNTSFMADYRIPVDPEDKRIYRAAPAAQPWHLPLAKALVQMAVGRLPQKPEHYIGDGQSDKFELQTDNVYGHSDGETMHSGERLVYSAGTVLTVSHSPDPVWMLKTQPARYVS